MLKINSSGLTILKKKLFFFFSFKDLIGIIWD